MIKNCQGLLIYRESPNKLGESYQNPVLGLMLLLKLFVNSNNLTNSNVFI